MNEKDTDLNVKVVPWSATQEVINTHSQTLLQHASIQEHLKSARYRILSVQPIELEEKTDNPVEPRSYRTTIYDYTNNRTIIADGRLDQLEGLTVEESSLQPLPTEEEFEAATKILLEDSDLGPALRERRLIPYRPMPPLIKMELPDGRIERTLAVGLFAPEGEIKHRIVGVNMIHDTVCVRSQTSPCRQAICVARPPVKAVQ